MVEDNLGRIIELNNGVRVVTLPNEFLDTIEFDFKGQYWTLGFQLPEWQWAQCFDRFFPVMDIGLALTSKQPFVINGIQTSVYLFLPSPLDARGRFSTKSPLESCLIGDRQNFPQKLFPDRVLSVSTELISEIPAKSPALFIDSVCIAR
jgi:hypothetical protein